MATESFTYKNVIRDDSTADKFVTALHANESQPQSRSSLVPDVEASLKRSSVLLKRMFSPSAN